MRTHLDLFSGIGGFALAAQWNNVQTIAFSEIEPYASAVLRKHWPNVPNLGDIRTITSFDQPVWLLTGGFPCQPFSVAGKQRGSADDRHLWPEMCRVIGLVRPTWVLGENVPGIVRMELDTVLADLEGLGYACWPVCVPACAVDAPHRRDRVWIVANTKRGEEQDKPCSGTVGRVGWEPQPVPWNKSWELALREFRGVDDGLSYKVDRVDCIRNAIVPQVAAQLIHFMIQAEDAP